MAIPRNLANIAPHVNASSTELVVNDGGANLDFRIEGDTDANLLFVDAGNDKLGIGTSSPSHKLDVEASAGNGTFVAEFTNTNSASDGRGIINLVGNSSGAVSTLVFAGGRYFGTDNDTLAVINNAAAGGISFCVGGIANSTRNEKARITSGGALCVGKTGIFDAELLTVENTANGESVYFWSSNASLTYPVQINRATRNTTNGTYEFFRCVGAGNNKFVIADSGNATNTNGSYGTISDAKLKQDITDATPQWDDIKNLRFRKYRLKSEVELDPNAKPFLGLIAQEAELVSPGLIEEQKDYEDVEVIILDNSGNPVLDEEGNIQTKTEMRPTGTVTKAIKTSILYMKAVKALQEAMERIETLEAKVAALEAQ